MGTKEVLFRTRDLPWGSDVRLYPSIQALHEQMPAALRESGSRVLKQDRGSSGHGVWRVDLVRDAESAANVVVRVQSAERGAVAEVLSFETFVEARQEYFRYFEGKVSFVDQPYASRLSEGMIRCYLVHDRVAGFGHQHVTALLPVPDGASAPDPGPRQYHGPDKPEFQRLKHLLETSWVPAMLDILEVGREQLPVIWDADFLLGPPTPDGEDTYILCEINVSGVFPIPDESVPLLVEATLSRLNG